jgi:Bifunctional DNA primase/polymerase, N-terminal
VDDVKNINQGGEGQVGLAEALRYARAGLRIFSVRADKTPLTPHGFKDASTDPATIEAWRQKWPHCEFAWAVPGNVVVVDVDVKHGKRGYDDFKRLAGCDARDVATASASTPSGGMQCFFAASKPYKNAVAIDGTGIDIRSEGGYVVLPGHKNGRQWVRELIGADGAMAQLLPAPAWLHIALRKPPLVLAPRAALAPPSSDSWSQRQAHAQLEKACARISGASCGKQDATRHAMCFFVGGLVARGDLDYATAYAALLEAAQAMPVHRDPWRNLDTRVARSLEAGMGRPLALSETETWIRDFRARMRLKRPGAHNG